ncbi:four helix bundle protein [bacterium]|nr:four helix bundle protein [bacterium]
MIEYTKRRNINRGYMKLEVWQDGIELFKLVSNILLKIADVDFKLKSQILSGAQSVPANIAEGYCRRSIKEYLYFLNVALGSLGETLTRLICLKEKGDLKKDDFERFDKVHYKIENKLLRLIQSLQRKKSQNAWDEMIPAHENVQEISS